MLRLYLQVEAHLYIIVYGHLTPLSLIDCCISHPIVILSNGVHATGMYKLPVSQRAVCPA